MNQIWLVTTKGCVGCKIMSNNIAEALSHTKKEISIRVKDVDELDKKTISTFGLTDFPTIMFFKNGELKFKSTGTVPYIVILRWIDVHLK